MSDVPVTPQPQAPQSFTTLEDIPDVPATPEPVQPQAPAAPPKKNWLEDKRIAALIAVVGFIIVGLVFYFIFSSAGII